MTFEPPPADASSFEIAPLPTPDPTQAEAREQRRILICQRCTRQNQGDPPCLRGSVCDCSEPIHASAPIAEEHPTQKPLPARRGAPKGNTNALKHGYYARRLHETEADELKEFKFHGVHEEILILRYFIRRLVEQSASDTDLANAGSYLRVISLAVTSLSRLLRIERILSENEEQTPN
jgi:hypothetical protein